MLARPVRGWRNTVANLAVIVIMIAGFGVGVLCWPVLERLTASNARRHAEDLGALLYDYNFGASMIFGIFGWIACSGLIVGLASAASAQTRLATFATMVRNYKRSPLGAMYFRRIVRKQAGESDPERFIRKMTLGWLPLMGGVTAILFALTAYALQRDVNAHSVFTPAAYVRSPFLPWGSRSPHPWASAVSVELGCNHVDRKNGVSDDLIYEIKFADGASVRIEDARPLAGTWLDAAERIDAQLVAAGATFQRWNWLNRNPLDPRCLAAKQRRHSEADYARLLNLLRVGK